jgi:hypothetical protein
MYAIFCETNFEFLESWYTFIKKKGNEIQLLHLQKQLQDIDWDADQDNGHFTLDIENAVSASTALQMIKVNLGNYYFHQKFDGEMSEVVLGIKKNESSRKKIKKAHAILGENRIRDFLSMEDLEGCTDIDDAGSYSTDQSTSPPQTASPHSVGQRQRRPQATETKDINPDELPQLLKNK